MWLYFASCFFFFFTLWSVAVFGSRSKVSSMLFSCLLPYFFEFLQSASSSSSNLNDCFFAFLGKKWVPSPLQTHLLLFRIQQKHTRRTVTTVSSCPSMWRKYFIKAFGINIQLFNWCLWLEGRKNIKPQSREPTSRYRNSFILTCHERTWEIWFGFSTMKMELRKWSMLWHRRKGSLFFGKSWLMQDWLLNLRVTHQVQSLPDYDISTV